MFDKKTIAEMYFNGDNVPGEVGIEIEVEGRNLPTRVAGWDCKGDGSLRGEAVEYVLPAPLPVDKAFTVLDHLYSRLSSDNVVWEDTTRSGIHVHVNIRDLVPREVLVFAMLYLVFEEALVAYCGEDRVGNLFCLRGKDAEFLLYMMKRATTSLHGFRDLAGDSLRYASINFTSILRYGSLEFRAMRSPVDKEVLKTWTNVLLHLKEMARHYGTPLEVVGGVSQEQGVDYALRVLGPYEETLRPEEGWDDCIKRGMRAVQPVANAYEVGMKKKKKPEKKTANGMTLNEFMDARRADQERAELRRREQEREVDVGVPEALEQVVDRLITYHRARPGDEVRPRPRGRRVVNHHGEEVVDMAWGAAPVDPRPAPRNRADRELVEAAERLRNVGIDVEAIQARRARRGA